MKTIFIQASFSDLKAPAAFLSALETFPCYSQCLESSWLISSRDATARVVFHGLSASLRANDLLFVAELRGEEVLCTENFPEKRLAWMKAFLPEEKPTN